jgi:Mg2+ and Co2+ transporter CorA
MRWNDRTLHITNCTGAKLVIKGPDDSLIEELREQTFSLKRQLDEKENQIHGHKFEQRISDRNIMELRYALAEVYELLGNNQTASNRLAREILERQGIRRRELPAKVTK